MPLRPHSLRPVAPGEPSELAARLETWSLSLQRRSRTARDTLDEAWQAWRAPVVAPLWSGTAVSLPPAEPAVETLRRWLDDDLRRGREVAVRVRDTALERWEALVRRLEPAFADRAPYAAAALLAAGLVGGTGTVAAATLQPTAPAGAVASASADLVPVRPAGDRGSRASVEPVAAPAPSAPPAAAVPPLEEAAAATPIVPSDRGALPLGMGMWIWLPERVEGGDVDALVARATAVGLDHIYVRTGSSKTGFYAGPYLDALLPKAHAAGIRVYGWDFPYLRDIGADVARSVAAITHTTPDGHRIDGFAADIETRSEGTNLTGEGGRAYGEGLRAAVGEAYPLVAVVPRPSPLMLARFPYADVVGPFDAIAPMTYWLNRQPDTDVINDVAYLFGTFGKPVIPVGQAYDGAPEGGRPGPPPPEEIARFLGAAEATGAVGASFWSWQHANQPIWDTIAAAREFRWEAKPPAELRHGQVRALQAQLTRLGFPVATTGAWDDATGAALAAYQRAARLPATGVLDEATLAILRRPFNPPVG